MEDTPTAVPVIVHYANGTLLKCYTTHAEVSTSQVLLTTSEGNSHKIRPRDLKALFWVKDFVGREGYRESRQFPEEFATTGQKVGVQFKDGERVVGVSHDYQNGGNGFHLRPADPQSNNLKIWVSRTFVERCVILN